MKTPKPAIPAVVYHYTTLTAMLNITQTASIWATSIRYLNDVSEREHFFRLIRARIPAYRDSHSIKENTIFDEVLDTSATYSFERYPFVACFTEDNGDSLPQCRKNPERKAELTAQRAALEADRKAKKDAAKLVYKALESRLTKKSLEAYGKCEGDALINFGATEQVRRALIKGSEMGLFRINDKDKHGFTEKTLPSTNDKKLERYAHVPVIAVLRNSLP